MYLAPGKIMREEGREGTAGRGEGATLQTLRERVCVASVILLRFRFPLCTSFVLSPHLKKHRLKSLETVLSYPFLIVEDRKGHLETCLASVAAQQFCSYWQFSDAPFLCVRGRPARTQAPALLGSALGRTQKRNKRKVLLRRCKLC